MFIHYVQVTDWNQIFLQVPADSLNLHLCSHCICTQLTSGLKKCLLGCIHTPHKVLRFVYAHVSHNNLSQWPKMYHFLLEQLLHYKNLAADVAQAKMLCALGLGTCVCMYHKYLHVQEHVYMLQPLRSTVMMFEFNTPFIFIPVLHRANPPPEIF